MPPAQAQGPSGGWTAQPCDASGNILSNPSYNNDGYVMGGTESGSDSTTYPLLQSYDTASTSYNNAPVPSGIGNYGSGGNEALADSGSDYFWYGQVYGTNTYATFNGTETVDLNGQLVYYFKEVWQGSGAPTTPMPDHIDLRLTTKVSAFAYVDYESSGQTSGLSGQATASDGDPFNESVTASASTPDASVLYQQAGGAHLVRASVSGGIAEVYLNGTVHMEANNAAPYGVLSYPMPSDPSYVWGTVTNGSTQARSNSLVAASVRQDSREVAISASVDVTNMKSPSLNSDGTTQVDAYNNIIYHAVPHSPAPDGTMSGDVGLGYGPNYIPGSPDPLDLYDIKYTPHLGGTWGANSTYSWFSSLKQSGGGGPSFGNTYIGAAVLYTDALPLINPGETSNIDHIHLTVIDSNDGTKGTANYYLSLHQPTELLPSNQAMEDVTKEIEEVETSAPHYAAPGLSVNCTWNAPGAYWDYLGGGVGAMAEIPGVDEVPWLGLFCAASGIAIDHLKPVADTGGASFEDNINQPKSTFPDEHDHPFATTPHYLFKMKPHILGLYKRTHLLRDTWDITGFISETPIDADVYERTGGGYGEYDYSP